MAKFLQHNKMIDKNEATVSPDDRGYYFGDGIYEVFRIYNGNLFEEEAHLARLERSARELRITLPYPIGEIAGLLRQLLAADPIAEGILYMQITRGSWPRTQAFPPEGTPAVLTGYCKPLPRPVDKLERGIGIVAVPDIRWLRCDIKTLNLLGSVLAKQEAVERGADEAVLHRDGIVTECSSSNIMIVKDGLLCTHPANNLILPGVTRQVVLRLARDEGVEIREEPFSLSALRAADEVFITGTTVEATPVVTVDGEPVGEGKPGPVTRLLQREFGKLLVSGN